MDLSQKIIRNEQEAESLRERTDFLNALELYDGDDKVMHFSDVIAELRERETDRPAKRCIPKFLRSTR